VIDSPHAKGHTGGVAAAPVFKRIAQAAMRQYGVPPSINPAPPLVVARQDTEDAHEQPTSTGGSTSNIVPLGGTSQGSRVFPDLRGLGARDALHALTRLGMTGRLNGTGIVTRQRPEAGTPIDRDATYILWLERQAPLTRVAGATR